MMLVIICVLLCDILLLLASFWRYRKKTLESYDALLQKLDNAIHGKVQETVYDESLDAAITERLNQIVQISAMQKGRAEEERDTVKSLISDISHQVRTPLSNIMLYVGLLKECSLDEKALALGNKIENNSEKLDFFMKELIKSSYAEQEIITVHPEKIEAEELISKACQFVELSALKKNITICRQKADGVCYADVKWTVEAIANILENAIKYSPEHTKVSIHAVSYESFICIQVKDSGIGIAEEEQGKVFQRFYRGENAKNSSGFGIGLYLAREVLAKQDGYIKLDSKLNQGTTVQMFLSRHPM